MSSVLTGDLAEQVQQPQSVLLELCTMRWASQTYLPLIVIHGVEVGIRVARGQAQRCAPLPETLTPNCLTVMHKQSNIQQSCHISVATHSSHIRC